jgi:hypothetical protein
MKQYEKDLYNELQIPVESVDSFAIIVKKFFTTVDGTIIDKNSVPQALQVRYPVILFNSFDRRGSFKISFNENPPVNGTVFYRSYIQNDGFDPTQFSGLNTVGREISIGDQVFVYTDNIENPSFFIYIIQTITDRSLGSIIESIPCSGLALGNLKYFSDDRRNYEQIFRIIKSNVLGIYNANSISPISLITPEYQQDNLALIPLTGNKLTPWWGIATYIIHDSDRLEFDFEFINVK